MKIKNQERIMRAVRELLDAESKLAAARATKITKRISQKRLHEITSAQIAACSHQADKLAELRVAHREIVLEEYGE